MSYQMFPDNIRAKGMWARLRVAQSGSTTILFAMSSVVLFGAMALAIDYAHWMNRTSDLQATADAAALAGAARIAASESGESATQFAQTYLEAKRITSSTSNVTVNSGAGTVTVTIAEPGRRYLSSVIGQEAPTIKVVAEAVAQGKAARPCIIALDPAAPVGIDFSLAGSVTAIDCAIWSNATSATSFDLNGSGTASSDRNCAVGGVSGNSFAITPDAESNCSPAIDPFLGWTPPASSVCDQLNNEKPDGGPVTLMPGVYCGGLKVTGTTQLTLEPGIYIIKDGPLKVNAGASINGTGVTILLTGTDSNADFLGSASVHLSAPTGGPTEGLVIASGRDEPILNTKVGGGVEMDIEGTVYLPTHHLSYGGNSESLMPSSYTFLIAKTITFHGGSTVVVRGDPETATVPAKNQAIFMQGTVRLTR
jgi:Putative Flp pilus-assembly TadE/G-like